MSNSHIDTTRPRLRYVDGQVDEALLKLDCSVDGGGGVVGSHLGHTPHGDESVADYFVTPARLRSAVERRTR
jgi:hypothetical protein